MSSLHAVLDGVLDQSQETVVGEGLPLQVEVQDLQEFGGVGPSQHGALSVKREHRFFQHHVHCLLLNETNRYITVSVLVSQVIEIPFWLQWCYVLSANFPALVK